MRRATEVRSEVHYTPRGACAGCGYRARCHDARKRAIDVLGRGRHRECSFHAAFAEKGVPIESPPVHDDLQEVRMEDHQSSWKICRAGPADEVLAGIMSDGDRIRSDLPPEQRWAVELAVQYVDHALAVLDYSHCQVVLAAQSNGWPTGVKLEHFQISIVRLPDG